MLILVGMTAPSGRWYQLGSQGNLLKTSSPSPIRVAPRTSYLKVSKAFLKNPRAVENVALQTATGSFSPALTVSASDVASERAANSIAERS